MPHTNQIVLDVREDLRNKRDPFNRIIETVNSLGPEDELVIVNIFEPVPLYDVMSRKGYVHHTEKTPEGDWKVVFSRQK